MELKDIIKRRRGSMSQSEFAQFCGVHRQLVYQWEKGTSKPSKGMMDKLGIRVKYIISRRPILDVTESEVSS
jgi:DNA-binding transcriptional regulator YiaG